MTDADVVAILQEARAVVNECNAIENALFAIEAAGGVTPATLRLRARVSFQLWRWTATLLEWSAYAGGKDAIVHVVH